MKLLKQIWTHVLLLPGYCFLLLMGWGLWRTIVYAADQAPGVFFVLLIWGVIWIVSASWNAIDSR